MSNCPQCHQRVQPQAIACPHCRKLLKAHGHPGMPLHRATGDESLCNTCIYHADDTCNFSKRPHAQECTLYSDRTAQTNSIGANINLSWQQSLRLWYQRYQGLIILLGLGIISFLIVLIKR